MQTVSHESMHRDHQEWLSENQMCRCDLSAWQEELRRAIEELAKIESALNEHERALQTHAAAIRLREQELVVHEHAIVAYEQGETSAELIPLAKAHEDENLKHLEQRAAHERIKSYHHRLIAHVNALRNLATHPE